MKNSLPGCVLATASCLRYQLHNLFNPKPKVECCGLPIIKIDKTALTTLFKVLNY